jgi:hypothetical protein
LWQQESSVPIVMVKIHTEPFFVTNEIIVGNENRRNLKIINNEAMG